MLREGFDFDRLLNDSIRNDQKEAAKGIYNLYRDFVEAGFNEDQAFELVRSTMIASIAAKGQTND